MQGFTPIRNGLGAHLSEGRLGPYDLGVYAFLHMHADWSTGVYNGCALTIAFGFGDPSAKEHIQKSLRRLRDRHYVNYRKGNGRRGAYPILINKYEPRVGELLGTRLNAWKHAGLARPEYEPKNCHGTVEEQSMNGRGAVVTPIQEEKEPKNEKSTTPSRAPLALPDWLPTEQWTGFVEMRKRIKAPLTDRAITLIMKTLEELRADGYDVGSVLDQSTRNNWKDVYPMKGNHSNGKGNHGNGNRAERQQSSNLAALEIAKAHNRVI